MDDTIKIEERIIKLDHLLRKCIDHWHLGRINKGLELTISSSQLDQTLAMGGETETNFLKELAKVVTPADWNNLGYLIQEYRVGGQTREKCLRKTILRADGKQKQYDLWLSEEREREAMRQAKNLREQAVEAQRIRREEEYKKKRLEEEAEREKKRQLEEAEQEKKRQADEAEKQRQILRDKEKQVCIGKLRVELENDFLNAHTFHAAVCAEYVTDEEFEDEKVEYVREWFKKHYESVPDTEQAGAIAEIKGDTLVVARAGSGKTLTLTNRAIFLLKHCGIEPNKMLLLAFNKKAAEEMRKRLAKASKGKLPHVMTFHALAHALVHPDEELIFDDSNRDQLGLSVEVQSVIDDCLRSKQYRDRIRELMMIHFKTDWEQIVNGHFELTMDEFLSYRRSLPRESLKGDYVKSFGEKLIANTLFEHGVEYKYERNFRWNGSNYRPDFTIPLGPAGNGGVIIEYFGLQGDRDYDEISDNKRDFWVTRKEWKFLEYSPNDITRGGARSFVYKLVKELEDAGISCRRLPEEEVWELIRRRAIDGFTRATKTFIGRCRKLNVSVERLRNMVDAHDSCNNAESLFLDIAVHIYEGYLKRLAEKGKEDFDGLMWRAVALLRKGQTHFIRDKGRERGDLALLRFVMIDEFQDFSPLFFELIQTIRSLNTNAEFFCVGDDWQAINSFAGSNLQFFKKFEDHFQQTKTRYIRTNYRSPTMVVDAGNALMHDLGMPARAIQTDKGSVFRCMLDRFKPSVTEQARHNGDEITPALLRVLNNLLNRGFNIVMLSRRNGVPWYVNYDSSVAKIPDALSRFLEHIRSFFPEEDRGRITISTVHQYKGLERPAVVILDVKDGSYPLIHPNWIFLRILGDTIALIEEEERRVFYVAITRSQHFLLFFTELVAQSPYLEDILTKVSINSLLWASVSPVPSLNSPRVEIKVHNAHHAREELSRLRFQWNKADSCWQKSVLAGTFSLDEFQQQPWVRPGNKIEVFDETGKLLKSNVIQSDN